MTGYGSYTAPSGWAGASSLRQIYRPTTTHMAPVICHYALRWAVESVPATRTQDIAAGRRSVRLVGAGGGAQRERVPLSALLFRIHP